MGLHDIPIKTLSGEDSSLSEYSGKALLIVNVASRCGLTPQYAGLQQLHDELSTRGFSVLGFPCNQFAGQEPGTADEIQSFCSTTYGVTFPLFEKIDVNGEARHPVYELLTATADASGQAGDVMWNFEKFVVSPSGEVVARYRPRTAPDAAELRETIESVLPG